MDYQDYTERSKRKQKQKQYSQSPLKKKQKKQKKKKSSRKQSEKEFESPYPSPISPPQYENQVRRYVLSRPQYSKNKTGKSGKKKKRSDRKNKNAKQRTPVNPVKQDTYMREQDLFQPDYTQDQKQLWDYRKRFKQGNPLIRVPQPVLFDDNYLAKRKQHQDNKDYEILQFSPSNKPKRSSKKKKRANKKDIDPRQRQVFIDNYPYLSSLSKKQDGQPVNSNEPIRSQQIIDSTLKLILNELQKLKDQVSPQKKANQHYDNEQQKQNAMKYNYLLDQIKKLEQERNFVNRQPQQPQTSDFQRTMFETPQQPQQEIYGKINSEQKLFDDLKKVRISSLEGQVNQISQENESLRRLLSQYQDQLSVPNYSKLKNVMLSDDQQKRAIEYAEEAMKKTIDLINSINKNQKEQSESKSEEQNEVTFSEEKYVSAIPAPSAPLQPPVEQDEELYQLRIQNLEKQLEEEKAKNQQKDHENNLFQELKQKRIEALEDQLAKQVEDLNKLAGTEQELEQAKQDLANHRIFDEMKQKEIVELEKVVQDQKDRIKELEGIIETLKAQIKEKDDMYDQLLSHTKELVQANNDLKVKIKEQIMKLQNEKEQIINNYKDQVLKLQDLIVTNIEHPSENLKNLT